MPIIRPQKISIYVRKIRALDPHSLEPIILTPTRNPSQRWFPFIVDAISVDVITLFTNDEFQMSTCSAILAFLRPLSWKNFSDKWIFWLDLFTIEKCVVWQLGKWLNMSRLSQYYFIAKLFLNEPWRDAAFTIDINKRQR